MVESPPSDDTDSIMLCLVAKDSVRLCYLILSDQGRLGSISQVEREVQLA